MSSGQNKEPTPEGGPPVPHHISDVDTWGHPDRNYFVFVALSIFMGLLGADHFYLRSYDTAFKKLLINVLGLGIWWFWDIIQIVNEGAKVRSEGLTSPLDWIRGIGRGVFVPLPADLKKGGAEEATSEKEYAAPKSYVAYTLLAIFLGALGADKFYIGENTQGLAKLFSVFNIFLFLFGILWVLWDAFNAFFRTEALLKDGISAPMPFSFFFRTPVDAQALFKVQEVQEAPAENSGGGFFSKIPFLNLYNTLMVPLLRPTVGSAVQTASRIGSVGAKSVGAVAGLSTRAPQMLGEQADIVGQKRLEEARHTSDPVQQEVERLAAAQQVQDVNRRQAPPQTGGGHAGGQTGGPGPVIAGALTALVVAGGAKGLYELLARQYN